MIEKLNTDPRGRGAVTPIVSSKIRPCGAQDSFHKITLLFGLTA